MIVLELEAVLTTSTTLGTDFDRAGSSEAIAVDAIVRNAAKVSSMSDGRVDKSPVLRSKIEPIVVAHLLLIGPLMSGNRSIKISNATLISYERQTISISG